MTKTYTTRFGSLADYQKGTIDIIDDDPTRYAFSNVFEVASKAKPYERIAVGKNFEYVIECLRAEGTSPWYTCGPSEACGQPKLGPRRHDRDLREHHAE